MAPKASEPTTYYLLPNLRALDTSACEVDLNAHSWVQPIVIDDEDLTFGGKSLSAWYEEDRSRLSSGGSDDGHSTDDHHHHREVQDRTGDEERRGRERVRRSHASSSSKSHRK